VKPLRTVPSSRWPNLRHARDERTEEAARRKQFLGRWARDVSVRRCSRPRRLWLAGGMALGVL